MQGTLPVIWRVALLVATLGSAYLAVAAEQEEIKLEEVVDELSLEGWQSCDIFLAPSTTGWGVYAARDFTKHEHVEATPLLVPVGEEESQRIIKNSVLDDYIYGYHRVNGEYASGVLFGYAMFFNHHPVQNVRYYKIGTGRTHTMGFVATRDIRAGEQLFSTYGSEDGGLKWFEARGMPMVVPEESYIGSEDLPFFQAEFCSNIYSGIGQPFWKRMLDDKVGCGDVAKLDESRLAPFDAGIGEARAKRNISKGSRIEIGPGLVMSKETVAGSVLGGLVLSWNDFNEEQKGKLRILYASGKLKVQYQSPDTDWKRVDDFTSFEDLSILPASGNIGMVRRVGDSQSSNCRLDILWETGKVDDVTVTMELIATTDIEAGEILLLDLPPAGTRKELELLKAELDLADQPYFQEMFEASVDEKIVDSNVNEESSGAGSDEL